MKITVDTNVLAPVALWDDQAKVASGTAKGHHANDHPASRFVRTRMYSEVQCNPAPSLR